MVEQSKKRALGCLGCIFFWMKSYPVMWGLLTQVELKNSWHFPGLNRIPPSFEKLSFLNSRFPRGNFSGPYLEDGIPWRVHGYVVNNHGDGKSPIPGVVGPLPNGRNLWRQKNGGGIRSLLTRPTGGIILQVDRCLTEVDGEKIRPTSSVISGLQFRCGEAMVIKEPMVVL